MAKRSVILLSAVALCATYALAQHSMIPPPCAGKTGEALDQCVRDITPPLTVRVNPVEPAQDPAQTVNCLRVHPADRNFCIARNEIIGECRNRVKYPDFSQCVTDYLSRLAMPRAADCSRGTSDARSECAARNKALLECKDDPLRYFGCLVGKMSRR